MPYKDMANSIIKSSITRGIFSCSLTANSINKLCNNDGTATNLILDGTLPTGNKGNVLYVPYNQSANNKAQITFLSDECGNVLYCATDVTQNILVSWIKFE